VAVIELLAARAPVVVAIDDVQWLDASSRAVVGFADRRLEGRVGILATARTGDPDCPDAVSWLQLPHPDALTRVRLRPLSLGRLHAVIAARLGRTLPRPVITRIRQISGGNPFYALELAGAVGDATSLEQLELPASLASVTWQRVGHFDDEVATVLLAAACATQPRTCDRAAARGHHAGGRGQYPCRSSDLR
jgi:predicted ATPase